VRQTDDDRGCGGGVGPRAPYVASIDQTGATVVAHTPFGDLDGTVAGSRVTLHGTLFDGVGYTGHTALTLDVHGRTMAGSSAWRYSNSPTFASGVCTGTSTYEVVPEMYLVATNLPGVANVALDQPIIFTFSDDVDPSSVTPDSVPIVGVAAPPFRFETIVVDGPLVALLPSLPSFDDLSDAGLAPGQQYVGSCPIAPAIDVVRSTRGAPLTEATPSVDFVTAFAPYFVEPRRPLAHAPGPLAVPSGRGDEDGCLDDADNALYAFPGFQPGTDDSAVLLCLKGSGAPRVLVGACSPTHDERDVGTPSAVSMGNYDLPAIRIRWNEPVDPRSATPFDSGTRTAGNVQLWRVGDVAGNALPAAGLSPVPTNKPVVVQSLASTEIILVPAGPQPRGIYVVLVRGITDLAGNPFLLSDAPDPSDGGYAAIDAAIDGTVPDGFRLYFRTP
jgi:hypothetical protein